MPLDPCSSQSTISAFFSSTPRKSSGKRAHSPIDLTSDADAETEERTTTYKKARINQKHPSVAPNGPEDVLTTSTSFVKTWSYSLDNVKEACSSKPRTAAGKERHEAFKKKLLQDNSLFLKKDEESVDPNQDQDSDDGDDGIGEESHKASEASQNLSELFSHRGKEKSRYVNTTNSRGKPPPMLGPSGKSYTPLEQQILRLKTDNPGTVLLVEVGYKYRFFGDDAKTASKELGMATYTDRNFLVASIPVHRRDVHLKKLISRGYRVGIVNQIETAALKKLGDNRNAPFDRQLTNLYTAATYVEGLDSVDDLERFNIPPFMCIIEETMGKDQTDVSIGMITVCPSTGDVVWDKFDDTLMRLDLETRLVHTRPAELLIPASGLSEKTTQVLSCFLGMSSAGHQIRTEHIKKVLTYSEAFSQVSNFYTDERKHGAASKSFSSGRLMAEIMEFPNIVVIALAHTIKYLSKFGLADALLDTRFFSKFTTKAHMLLAANSLINLEIYRNEADYTTHGSLLWVLDRTKTKFGARLLRSWVGKPLVNKRILEERIDAVQEILESNAEVLLSLRAVIKNLPDLAKGLSRIQYGQCTPKELSVLLAAFNKVAHAFDSTESENHVASPILNEIVNALPRLKEPMKVLMATVNLKRASEGKKEWMWNDSERYPEIIDAEASLAAINEELKEELKAIRKTLRMPSLVWKTVAIDDYLVEVKRCERRPIPENWILHSKTKNLARYYPPSVRAKLDERAQHREILQAEANRAYGTFLREISDKYYGVLRDAVNKLATADCLLSLAQVSLQENYVRPQFVEEDILEIIDGRHPMIEAFSDNPYIPNSIHMGGNNARSKIITGPNMGGKSSCVRMIALIVLMAQVGCYVPATSVKMGLVDSILTRMGASDDLARGRSTFMVEMSETSEILQTATSRSLVILDELGRGTSTFDGMAIADATLQYLVESKKSKTLFITHYPMLATKLEAKFPRDVQNLHMGYEAESRINGTRDITFLYRLVPGLAMESFGIECARSAGLLEKVLSIAEEQSRHLHGEVELRIRRNNLCKAPYLIHQCLENTGIKAEVAMEELHKILELL